MSELTEETKTLATILRHQKQVSFLLRELAREFERRADLHDMSKFQLDEFEGFCRLDNARKYEYGSEEYEARVHNNNAAQLHVTRNSHHPEYWPGGVADMSFADLVEMLCDWEIARQTRDTEGDINKTWLARQKRFNLSDQELYLLRTMWEKMSTPTAA